MNWSKAVQQPLYDTQAEQELKTFLREELPEFQPPIDPDKWQRQVARLRRQVLDSIYLRGFAPDQVNEHPRVVWGDSLQPEPTYRIHKLRYEIYPGYWIPALLYEPTTTTERLPVGIMYMGHGLNGKAGCQVHCVNMVRRGMLAMTPEFIGMGELTGDVYHNRQGHLALTGLAGPGLMYLAMQKGLDVVLAHPRADHQRVAVTGSSGGGWQAILIAALDSRVTLCAPVAGYTSVRARVEALADVGDLEQVPVDLTTLIDYPGLSALFAPRPLLQIFNENDDCCFATARVKPAIYDPLLPVYRAFGAAGNLAFYSNRDPGNHNYDADNRTQLYRFLNRHFGLSTPEEDIHQPEDILPADRLDIGLPTEQESFLSLGRKRAYALCANRPPCKTTADRARLRERLTEVLRLPQYQVCDQVICRRGDQHQHLLRLDPWTVPMTALTPPDAVDAELRVADRGRAHFTTPPEPGRNVFAADIFDTGENSYTLERKMLLECAGHRLLGIQVAQLLALAQWAKDQTPSGKLHLIAAGYTMSTAALIAAALHPDRFTRVSLFNILGTLKSLFDWAEKYEQRQSLFCFGLLEVCDLPDLLPLLEGVELITDR